MYKLQIKLILIIFIALAVPSWATEQVRFGVIGSGAKKTLNSLWLPLLKDMEKGISIPVKAVIFDDYGGTVTALKEGKIDLAWMGNKLAIEAVDNADAEIFAQIKNMLGVPGYYSMLIAHKDKPFRNEHDVMSNSSELYFGFGEVHSTSGTTVRPVHQVSQADA